MGLFSGCDQRMPAPKQQCDHEIEQQQVNLHITRDEYSAYTTSLNFCITYLQANMSQELQQEAENGRKIATSAANRQGITPAQWIENAPTEVKAARLRLLNLMGYPADPNN
jgi:hypothetical protein